MSTPAPARISAGVPNGGQFAPSSLSESAVVLDGDAAPAMPAWDDLESKLSQALEQWATNLEDGEHDTDFGELIGDDEDAMTEAYDQGRSDYLCGLAFHADAQNWWVSGGLHEPSEGGINGRLKVAFRGRQIAMSHFSEQDAPDITGLLDRCVTAPDGTTTVQSEHRGSYGKVKEFRDASTGELTDGPDGTAAFRTFERDGVSDGGLRERVYYLNGVKHGASLTIDRNGSTVNARFVHGVPTDGPNLEPAIKTTHADGATTIEHHPKGEWAHTIETDAAGRVTSQNVADTATGGTIRTDFDESGRTHATRRDAQGVEQDGPNGEPAVEFRRPGSTVPSQTWYTNGTWTRTRDYNSAGETVVEFNNS